VDKFFLSVGLKQNLEGYSKRRKTPRSPPPGGSQGKPATKSEEIDIPRIGFLNPWINTLPAIT
jgi:hypothetical protein